MRVGNTPWPVVVTSDSGGEIVEVEIFSEDRRKVRVAMSKLKPFGPLKNKPKNKSEEWMVGYNLALDKYM